MAVKVDGDGPAVRRRPRGGLRVRTRRPGRLSSRAGNSAGSRSDSIIIGLEFRGDDLYVLTVDALYVVPDGRVQRDGLAARARCCGACRSTSMSASTAWPGDRRATCTSTMATRFSTMATGTGPTTGATGHCSAARTGPRRHTPGRAACCGPARRDRLKVVAGGLRGPVGLAFDRDWNLFTNDNDHESRADQYAPARSLHVTPHADFGWPRGWIAWEESRPRRPARADDRRRLAGASPATWPIMTSRTWPTPCLPACSMCRWDRMAVYRYPLDPRGASFAHRGAAVPGRQGQRPADGGHGGPRGPGVRHIAVSGGERGLAVLSQRPDHDCQEGPERQRVHGH